MFSAWMDGSQNCSVCSPHGWMVCCEKIHKIWEKSVEDGLFVACLTQCINLVLLVGYQWWPTGSCNAQRRRVVVSSRTNCASWQTNSCWLVLAQSQGRGADYLFVVPCGFKKRRKKGRCLKRSWAAWDLSLIHIWRCRRNSACRSRWSPYH